MKNLPQHPGLFLQTKCSKGSKLRSISLSLDALLDYNDKDIEESTFELSLFAESTFEMLQYQMGCRLLAFLEDASNPENGNTMPKEEASAAGLVESNMEDNTDEEDPEEDVGEYQETDDTVLSDPHEAGNDEEVADLQGKRAMIKWLSQRSLMLPQRSRLLIKNYYGHLDSSTGTGLKI
ncbi:protein SHORT ROOT IN SALT MEDIUM 1-like isoform X2 [Magnolia sinica]|uniref:protein SHORT ROOT IN SALT MEDIUM 1-like isoform X2 n=1 Tax=Magnolia sinica TaxID=86752 RepID=UPI00265ACC90|nr:protein SHORT ROOT IN SALT MEDIUM 1-like isoform X2 [Magnolia sinica]